jgi:hypothetical protein
MVEKVTLTSELLRKALISAATDNIFKSAAKLAKEFDISISQVNNYCLHLYKALEIPGNSKESLSALKESYKTESIRVIDAIDIVCSKVGEIGIGTKDANPLVELNAELNAELKFNQPLALNALAETAHPMMIADLIDNPVDEGQINPHFIPHDAVNKILIITYDENDDYLAFDGGFFLALLETDMVNRCLIFFIFITLSFVYFSLLF